MKYQKIIRPVVKCGKERPFNGRMVTCDRYMFRGMEMCDKCLDKKNNWIGKLPRFYPNKWNPKVVLDLSL